MKNTESLYIRVIEYALKYPEGFKFADIIKSKELNLKEWEVNLLSRHFHDACRRYNEGENTKGETIFLFIHGDHQKANSPDNDYILNFETEFTYIDYQELKFARENAREAKSLSIRAIVISVLALVASIVTPIFIAKFMTQTVEINSTQLQSIIGSKK
ncbi:hypothetical protein KW782_04650 [Candidatus Parcubacteria bacterium]|nr:hypothetical protein [Candidatus Parcubacteria bacterium]